MRAASVASQIVGRRAGSCRRLPQGAGARFAEIGEQAHAPAIVRLGQRQQGIELAALQRLNSSPAGLSSIMRRWFTTSGRP